MATRKNWCINPASKYNVTGYAGNNEPVNHVTDVAGMPAPVETAARYTGNGYARTPTGLCVPGIVNTVSFYIKNNTGFEIFGGRQVFVGYTLSIGGETFPAGHDFNTTALGPNGNVIRGSFTAPSSPANTDGIFLIIDSLNGTFGNGFDISAVMYERSATLGTYFDGSFPNSVWDGDEGNSTSTYTDPPDVSPGAFLPLL